MKRGHKVSKEGYIKLHRKTLENPIVCKDAEYFTVWVYLLLSAAHSDIDIIFNNERMTLKSGQLITGRKTISEKFNIDQSKVQRILKTLKNEQQIEQQTTTKNRLITVLNWCKYQSSEQQNEQRVNNNCTTSEQQVNTYKNDKNIKNDKKDIYIGDCEEEFQSFVEFRKRVKKPMTDYAVYLMKKKLTELTDNEEERKDILRQSVLKGWTDIYPLDKKGEANATHKPNVTDAEQRNRASEERRKKYGLDITVY